MTNKNMWKKNLQNKRGQFYIIAVIIAIIFALISSFIFINFQNEAKSENEYLGSYQSGMIDTILEGDRSIMYLEQSAQYSVHDALQEFAQNGGTNIYTEQGEEKPSVCKTYVYPLWNSESVECFPNYRESFVQYMYKSLVPRLANNKDTNFNKETPFDFKYAQSNIYESKISALSEIQYEYYVFKDRTYKENEAVQKYVENKQTYSDGNSYTVGVGNCADIVSFANEYIGVSWSKNTVAQPPDKAKSTGLQCGAFVTSVFKYGSNMAAPLGNGNQKCYNFATNTVSPTVELIYKRDTDFRCITSVSCMNDLASLSESQIDSMNLLPGDIFSSTTPTSYGHPYGHTGIYVGKGRLENPKNSWQYTKFVPDSNGKHVAIHSGVVYSYISDLEANNRKMIAFCRHKGCITDENPVNSVECQLKDNDEWKITNIMVSQSEVSADKTIKITTTIENPSKECASVVAIPVFSQGSSIYNYESDKYVEVYTDNSGKKYANIEVECMFITDSSKLNSLRAKNKCVLLAPSDNTKIKYTINGRARDVRGRSENIIKEVTFEVSKSSTLPTGSNGSVSNGSVSNTSSQTRTIYPVDAFMKTNYAAVKKNMDKYKVTASIIKFSAQYGIPSEIVFGKMTQESGGVPGKPTGEKGLGGGLGQTTFSEFEKDSWAKPVRDKGCKVENFLKTDEFSVECQVEAAILHFLDKKKSTDNNNWYESAVKKNCANPTYQQLYLSYPEKSWERALRAYNGFGCKPVTVGKNVVEPWLYVGKVMGYAGLWGYSGTVTQISQYEEVSRDEIESKGIIGKYFVNPSFTVDVPFDFSLIDNLSNFMNATVNECVISPLGKKECLNSKIVEFNNNTAKYYKSQGVYIALSRECDESKEEKYLNEFMESVENCANSPDFDCQCTLKKDSLNIKIESYPESSKFYFTKSGITYEVNSYNKILDSNNNPLTLDSNLNNINLYKKLGYLKVANTNDRACSIPESRFRLCLKTDYKTEDYDGRSVNKKNVTLKFAITIKDNDTPPPLTGVEAINKPNSRNSVMVTFDESKKDGKRVPDIESYVIYLSDMGADFNKNMEDIRKTTHYRTLDVASKGYEVIRELDLNTNPECEIVDEKYCKFIYSAKDSDGNEIKTELHEDKLYYLADKEKFLYILNGTDSYNDLKSGREKFIAVTAVDTDGNEIDNINTSEKIIPGQNLVSITPIDNLAPGFVKIQTTTILNIITISYSKPEFFINGEPMDNSVIVYQAYIDWDCTDLNNPDFCSIKIPFNSIAETGDLMMQLDKTQNTFDRVGIIPAIKNSNVQAKYNSAYTERS